MAMRFSASSAAMLMTCSAAANLDLAIPNWVPPVVDETAGMRGEGTLRHEMFAQFNKLNARAMRDMLSVFEYVAEIRGQRRFKVMVEESVQATWLDSKPHTTADLVLYTQDEIHVFDFKWGKIPVEVIDNHQLLFYAVCYAPLAPKAKGVMLHILQPRAEGNTSWFADTTVLQEFMAAAQLADKKILAGDLSFGPSDHCTFCPANPHSRGEKGAPLCPEMMQLLYPRVTVDEDEILNL